MVSMRDETQASSMSKRARQLLRNMQQGWKAHVEAGCLTEQISANNPFQVLATLLFSLYSAVGFISPPGNSIPTASHPLVPGKLKFCSHRSGKPLHLIATRQPALTHRSDRTGEPMKWILPKKERSAASDLTRKLKLVSSVADLLEVHQQHAAVFNHIHLGVFWNMMGKLVQRERDWQQKYATELEFLHRTVTEVLPTSATCSIVAHGMAKAGVNSKGAWVSVWSEVARQTAADMGELEPQDFAGRIWALAKAEHDELELFQALAREAMSRLPEFNARQLATTAWVFGKVKLDELRLFPALASEATPRVHELNSQDIANIAWGFARANVKAPDLFEALAREASRQLHRFEHRALANTAWAFAAVEHPAPELFSLLAREATRRVREFAPLGLANIAWAFAKTGNDVPQLFEALAAKALNHLHDLDEVSLSNLAWAFAAAGHRAPGLYEALACEATRRAHKLSPLQIVNIAYFFTTFDSEGPRNSDALEGEPTGRSATADSGSLQPVPAGRGFVEDSGMTAEVADLFTGFRSQALQRLGDFDLVGLLSLQSRMSMARVLDAGLEKEICNAVTIFGKEKDEAYPATTHRDEVRPQKNAQSKALLHLSNAPMLLSEGETWLALYKPPCWLVDVDEKEDEKMAAAMLLDDDDDDDDGSAVPNELQKLHEARSKQKHPKFRHWITNNFKNEYPMCADPLASHGVLHRLDLETSGVLLCAKSHAGRQQLRLRWGADTFEKEYICLVHGWLDPSMREVCKRIRKGSKVYDESQQIPSIYCSVSPNGRPAHTELVTLAHLVKPESEGIDDSIERGAAATLENEEVEHRYSLVAVKLHTGRTHQIRVHMLSLGHPLVGEQKYAETNFNADGSWCARTFLHSYRLGFENIVKDGTREGDLVSVICPLPDDLRTALGKLTPADARSARLQADWMSGDSERARKFQAYAQETFGAEASSVN